jgi:ribosomal protein S18 acetylase RimI-like enzyme
VYRIVLADTTYISTIIQIADATWAKTYANIISEEQISMMYANMYSESSLQSQMEEGFIFAIAYEGNDALGFVAYNASEVGIYISKLYVDYEFQKTGVGAFLLSHVETYGKENNKKWIRLNVNRNNPALEFYKKHGFHIFQSVDIPYYQFVLNDFIMQKVI